MKNINFVFTAHPLIIAPPPVPAARSIPPRHPPSYSVAAQMARLHRIGRAHSHEGVTSVPISASGSPSPITNSSYLQHVDTREEDDGKYYYFINITAHLAYL